MKYVRGEPRPETLAELEQAVMDLDLVTSGATVVLKQHGLRVGAPRRFATATVTDEFNVTLTTGEWATMEELEEAFADIGVSDFKRH